MYTDEETPHTECTRVCRLVQQLTEVSKIETAKDEPIVGINRYSQLLKV